MQKDVERGTAHVQKGALPASVLQLVLLFSGVKHITGTEGSWKGTTLVQKGGHRRNNSYAEEDSPGMCLTMSLLYRTVKHIAVTSGV